MSLARIFIATGANGSDARGYQPRELALNAPAPRFWDRDGVFDEGIYAMRPCPSCDRHIRGTDTVCPFCETPRKTSYAPPSLLISVAFALSAGIACSNRPIGESESGGSGETGVVPTPTTEATSSSTGSTSGGTTGVEDSSDDGDDTCSFYAGCAPDWGGIALECDVWAQDCPPGEKCMPWANDGGSAWNATKCTPIDPDPKGAGEACTVEGSGVSGVDDCDSSKMCWDVDTDTNVGECVAFCVGSEANPSCEDPEKTCVIANDGVLILCLPTCDPIVQDCGDGDGCYAVKDGFACMPDASGPDFGAQGDPCLFFNVCDPGLYCAPADEVPGCQGLSCCTAFCNVEEVDMCPAGTTCTPWFEEGEGVPNQAHIGACIST